MQDSGWQAVEGVHCHGAAVSKPVWHASALQYAKQCSPVDGAAVNERGKLPEPLPEGVADGAEAQHHVQALAGLVHKVVPQLDSAVQVEALLLGKGAALLEHSGSFVIGEHVGDLGGGGMKG